MALILLFIPETRPRQDHPDGLRAVFPHGVDLPWGGVRAQNNIIFVGIEGVPHIPGRMVRGNIEKSEVEIIGFDFRALVDLESHLPSNPVNLLGSQIEGVDAPSA